MDDLIEDLKDGVRLIALLEVLANTKLVSRISISIESLPPVPGDLPAEKARRFQLIWRRAAGATRDRIGRDSPAHAFT